VAHPNLTIGPISTVYTLIVSVRFLSTAYFSLSRSRTLSGPCLVSILSTFNAGKVLRQDESFKQGSGSLSMSRSDDLLMLIVTNSCEPLILQLLSVVFIISCAL